MNHSFFATYKATERYRTEAHPVEIYVFFYMGRWLDEAWEFSMEYDI